MGNSLDSIIFQPPRPSTYIPEDLAESIRFAQSGSDRLAYLVRRTRQAPLVLVFYSHGNAEDLGGVDRMIAELSSDLGALGLPNAVVAYDYSGYGQSSGRPSEATVFRNAEDVLRGAMEEFKLPPERVVVWGRSLGSGPTCYLAHRQAKRSQRPFAGVVLQSPLLSVFRVGLNSTSYYRWPLDQFCNYERVRDGLGDDTKVFVIHGTVDQVVPFSHGKTICECIPEHNRHPPLFVKGAGHNDVEWRLHRHGPDGTGHHANKDLNRFVAEFIHSVFAAGTK